MQRLRRALASVFDDPHIEEITAEDLLGDCPAVQYERRKARHRRREGCSDESE